MTMSTVLDNESCRSEVAKAKTALVQYYDNEERVKIKYDLCRISALFNNGGYAMDVEVRMLQPLVLDESIKFAIVSSPSGKAFLQSWLATTQHHPVMAGSLDLFLDFYEGRTTDKHLKRVGPTPEKSSSNLHSIRYNHRSRRWIWWARVAFYGSSILGEVLTCIQICNGKWVRGAVVTMWVTTEIQSRFTFFPRWQESLRFVSLILPVLLLLLLPMRQQLLIVVARILCLENYLQRKSKQVKDCLLLFVQHYHWNKIPCNFFPGTGAAAGIGETTTIITGRLILFKCTGTCTGI